MDQHHLKEEVVGFCLLVSIIIQFCVLNCFVYCPLDRRKYKSSYRDVNYN